jgi:hypothetical protein
MSDQHDNAADIDPADAEDVTEVMIELKKPIKAHGDKEVTKIVCRRPTAGDIMDVGNPVRLNFGGEDGKTPEVTFNDKRMGLMLARLGGIPPSSVKQIAPRDFVSACWALQSFFLPA